MAVFGMVVPAMAHAPAPKVTITGLIDQIGTYTSNMSTYDLNYGRSQDDEAYGRTRGRFDIVGEVGQAKAVLGFEIDAYWGQSGNTDSAVTGGKQGFGANIGWDQNTDSLGIEVKWLYTEFPMFLVPDTKVRLGAQRIHFDFSKAWTIAMTMVLGWAWFRRITGSLRAAALGSFFISFAGGARWVEQY